MADDRVAKKAKTDEDNVDGERLDLPIPFEPFGAVDSGVSEESRLKALQFKPRKSDVVIATFAKTGTTLVSWMVHQIRTGGDTDFEDLYQVCPWILLCWDLGMDPNLEQPSPRIFKSHLRLGNVYRGCRYLVTLRDPEKTAISFYNFMKAKEIPSVVNGTCSDFVYGTEFLTGDGKVRLSLWDYYKEYWLCKDCPNVFVVVYEELVKNMPTYIRWIAKWLDIPMTDELVEKVRSMCSKEYMAQHESKLDETWVHARAVKLGRSPDNASMWKPAKRVVTHQHKDVLDDKAQAVLKEKWGQIVEPVSGLKTYREFAAKFTEINKSRFD